MRMKNWYTKMIVPRLLNFEMGSADLENIRHEALGDASGVVLEVGAGPGYNFGHYKGVSRLYALEPSKELINIAKTRIGPLAFPVEFLNVGAEHIPLPDCSVDTVVSTWVLCSVTDPRKVLNEIARVLRPQGSFIFVDHGASPKSIVRVIQRAFTSVSKYFTGNCHYDRRLEDLMKETGFVVKGIKHPRERFAPLIYNYQGVAYKINHKR